MANSSTDSSSLAQLENGAAAESGALVVDTTDNSTTSDEGTQIVATPAGPQDEVLDDADTPSTGAAWVKNPITANVVVWLMFIYTFSVILF
jgi:hypothetical protein